MFFVETDKAKNQANEHKVVLCQHHNTVCELNSPKGERQIERKRGTCRKLYMYM